MVTNKVETATCVLLWRIVCFTDTGINTSQKTQTKKSENKHIYWGQYIYIYIYIYNVFHVFVVLSERNGLLGLGLLDSDKATIYIYIYTRICITIYIYIYILSSPSVSVFCRQHVLQHISSRLARHFLSCNTLYLLFERFEADYQDNTSRHTVAQRVRTDSALNAA